LEGDFGGVGVFTAAALRREEETKSRSKPEIAEGAEDAEGRLSQWGVGAGAAAVKELVAPSEESVGWELFTAEALRRGEETKSKSKPEIAEGAEDAEGPAVAVGCRRRSCRR